MMYNSKLSETEKAYGQLLFQSWSDVKTSVPTFVIIALITGGLCYWLFDSCRIISVICGLISFLSILFLLYTPYEIMKMIKIKREYELEKQLENEKRNKKEKRLKEIKEKYPHAYYLSSNGVGYYNGKYDDISAFKDSYRISYTKKSADMNIFDSDEEWKKREDAALRALENIRMRREIAKYINICPLSFYKFCRYDCNACFVPLKDGYNYHDILLPGMRNPERFKIDKEYDNPTLLIHKTSESVLYPYKGLFFYGTSSDHFPPISTESLKNVYEKSQTLDIKKLKQEQELLLQQLREEDILINYNYNVYNKKDRDIYVEDFLDYMNVSDNKMEYVLANLERLDEYINLQKAKLT